MKQTRLLGFGLIIVGFLLLCIAYQTTDPTESLGSVVGRYTEQTVWYIIGGLILCIVGVLLAVFGPRMVE